VRGLTWQEGVVLTTSDGPHDPQAGVWCAQSRGAAQQHCSEGTDALQTGKGLVRGVHEHTLEGSQHRETS